MSDILIVDDERDIRELISDILEDEGYATRKAANSEDCMAAFSDGAPALLILDIWLKDSQMDGIDILKVVKRDYPEVPVVIISGHGNIEIAVAAIKQGAYDFIEKPFNIDQLMVVIRRAMETSRLRRENTDLRRKDVGAADMVGTSPAFRGLIAQLDKVTKSNGRVMLTGPAGSGKEVAARYIHSNSNRASAPFITVNCASIEPERMEDVLFGRESSDRGVEPGLLEQADGGVVFFSCPNVPLRDRSDMMNCKRFLEAAAAAAAVWKKEESKNKTTFRPFFFKPDTLPYTSQPPTSCIFFFPFPLAIRTEQRPPQYLSFAFLS